MSLDAQPQVFNDILEELRKLNETQCKILDKITKDYSQNQKYLKLD